MLYFVDLEASSLLPGGFPVEIAWVCMDGEAESHLIRPHNEWLEGGCPGWSRESEAIHGISLDTLIREGSPVGKVAARAAEVLSPCGVMACSDAPGLHGRWLETMFAFGGQPPSVALLNVRQVYGWTCQRLLDIPAGLNGSGTDLAQKRVGRLAADIVRRAEKKEVLRGRPRHRALADAEGLWSTWHDVLMELVSRLQERSK